MLFRSLQEDIRKQIGECLGSDYFVIPSSIHEVLILPDNGIFQVPELNAMVKEVNETQVEREEQMCIRDRYQISRKLIVREKETEVQTETAGSEAVTESETAGSRCV